MTKDAAQHTPPKVTRFTLGPYQTNCYIVTPAQDDTTSFIIDCGMQAEPLLDAIGTLPSPPGAIILTHAHIDHIAGLHEARRRFPAVPIWIHEREENWLLDAEANLSALGGFPTTAPPADRLLTHGETLSLAGHEWEVRHTPGHSPGSITLWSRSAALAFVGDALFQGSIGRTDFPGCSFDELAESIRTQLYTLPPETVILPGHMEASTIAAERESNPFVRPIEYPPGT
ncbi:MAG: MBL fold metallo-hydrolase [Planctomycetota bacterium]